jgi:hypothetical protein
MWSADTNHPTADANASTKCDTHTSAHAHANTGTHANADPAPDEHANADAYSRHAHAFADGDPLGIASADTRNRCQQLVDLRRKATCRHRQGYGECREWQSARASG